MILKTVSYFVFDVFIKIAPKTKSKQNYYGVVISMKSTERPATYCATIRPYKS